MQKFALEIMLWDTGRGITVPNTVYSGMIKNVHLTVNVHYRDKYLSRFKYRENNLLRFKYRDKFLSRYDKLFEEF